MSKASQIRFYDIAECYLDDERVMAWAVAVFCPSLEVLPEIVYRDLLAGRYGRWIDHLEQMADDMCHSVLNEWCKQKEFELDMMGDYFWSPGDSKIIESNGWKLTPGGNQEEED